MSNFFWSTPTGRIIVTVIVGLSLTISARSAQEGRAQTFTVNQQKLSRLSILDRNGEPIAETISAFDLWFVPHDFWGVSPVNSRNNEHVPSKHSSEDTRRALLLNALSDWPQVQSIVSDRLTSRNKSDTRQKILAWAIDPIIAKKIATLNIAGLRLIERPARHYPKGSLFAHPIGFVRLSDIQFGQEGLELVANYKLRAPQGKGERLGMPLQTTLDPEIQGLVRNTLQKGVATYGAVGAAAVVVEVQSGAIRAMVSSPDFDPNDASTYRNPYQPERILNRAVAVNFPIGSLLAPLLVAHGIDTGRFQPTTVVNLGKGPLKIDKTIIRDTHPEETLSIAEIVAKSSNNGLAKVAMQLPIAEVQGLTKSLGIGETLGISGLIGGVNHETIAWGEWTPGMQAEPGMHIETNLMQVVKAYLPIANGGVLKFVSILNGTENHPEDRVFSADTTHSMRLMLETASGPTGTAPKAQAAGTRVAGKTATVTASRLDDFSTPSKPTQGSSVAAFVGMAPALNPQWLVGIIFQFPQGSLRYSGETSAPVFSKIIHGILNPEK